MPKPAWSDLEVVSQLSSGYRWYGSVISYAFPMHSQNIYGANGEGFGFSSLSEAQISGAQLALFAWNDLIRINLQQTVSVDSDIEFGYTNTGIEYAHAYFPDVGSVWFSSEHQSLLNPYLGGYGFNTYVHEIGHALGLDHMGDYNGADTSGPSSWQDSSVYTVMSYYGPSNSLGGEEQVAWADWIGSDGVEYSPQTPMINDVMAIQSIYGQGAARSDNTVYGFDSNITDQGNALYDFSKNQHPILCIYDSGGVDTLNLDGWDTPSVIDLRGGAEYFSSCNAMTNNIQIARGVFIENATAGAGDDVIYGNTAANFLQGNIGKDTLSGAEGNDTLYGGAGDDFINGGLGVDTIVLAGNRTGYLINYQVANGIYLVSPKSGLDGTDVVSETEWAQFADQTVELAFLASHAVYRFFNSVSGVHFYTGSAIEAEHVRGYLPAYSYEGIAFNKNESVTGDAIDVYRFYNISKGAHFYTANNEEADYIRTNLEGYRYEGVAYQAHSQFADGTAALYRFFNTATGTHFYTASVEEKDNVVIELAGTLNYEGIAFYVDL